MTPRVDGRLLSIEFRGLYDGVSIMWDRETGTLWHHITGEGLHGPLAGRRLEPVGNLLHTTAGEALAADPATRVAISDRPIRQQSRWAPWIDRLPVLGPVFRRTMAREDTRRPTMDTGLGVWHDSTARYYSLDAVAARGDVLVDRFAGRRLVVYRSPRSRMPAAFYAAADSAWWEGEVLRLSTGDLVRDGALYDARGARREFERPLQLFTRWYGFALTFPHTDVFGR